jgi:MFS transporter, putative metabolite:H+ symporter
MQMGIYRLTLWVPTLFAQLLGVSPKEAARLMIFVRVGGFAGSVVFAYLSM